MKLNGFHFASEGNRCKIIERGERNDEENRRDEIAWRAEQDRG